MELKNTEMKMQYILDENKNLAEIPLTDMRPVEHPIKCKLISAFEVFVRVPGTENYWISNYGRGVNNHRNPNKNKFYEHKQGQCHLTIYEVLRPSRSVKGKTKDEMEVEIWKRETSPEELVVKSFLKQYRGRFKVWHKNGDFADNWYKNLIYVSDKDFRNLKAGKIIWQELGYEQEYIEYVNNAKNQAMTAYGSISSRCKGENNSDSAHKCYDTAEMCQEWKDNPQLFIKQYLELYYEVPGESMAVDKDLFGNGSKVYSPETICILPQGINTLLANCKKHYKDGETPDNVLPLGVRYNGKINKYYSEITYWGTEDAITLPYRDTIEEAFADYKKFKECDIAITVSKYRDKIPEYIYEKLLTVRVEPY